jgi:hypothetical protein
MKESTPLGVTGPKMPKSSWRARPNNRLWPRGLAIA